MYANGKPQKQVSAAGKSGGGGNKWQGMKKGPLCGPENDQPFKDPIIIPRSKNFCTIGYRISSGTAETTMIAYFSEA